MTKPRPHRPVLIVEDHPDTREMVEVFLKIDGFAVCTAADGFEALMCVAEHRPCIILLDISMPRMDGIAFGRALRGHADQELASIPIVLVSALEDGAHHKASVGAVDVIRKPISLERIIAVIEAHCS